MFCVVEFDDSAVSVVNSKWLTPRKKECFWPPEKDIEKFNTLLIQQDPKDISSWRTYNVKRKFFETGKFNIAFYFTLIIEI